MNTRAVAELLGISVSTVQRWVKQLSLEMVRNELGHFVFSEDNIEILKQVKQQLQQGKLLQDVEIGKDKRTGLLKTVQSDESLDKLASKVKQIETSLHQKADSVVSYQLLQHRREIDELQEQITNLSEKLVNFEELLIKERELAASGEGIRVKSQKLNRKKNKFLQAIFGS